MKLCPFISHLLGEDNANTLTAITAPSIDKQPAGRPVQDDSGPVVILGYDDDGWGGGVQTETISKTSSRTINASHLMCLKEPCRFYQQKSKKCMFESMHSLLETQWDKDPSKRKEKPAPADPKVLKELEKVWKLQTKSVAELIASIGESEKKHQDALELLQSELGGRIDSLREQADNNQSEENPLSAEIGRLEEVLADREDAIENFSTTLSETVVNLEDNVQKLSDKLDRLADEFASLKHSESDQAPRQEELDGKIQKLSDEFARIADGFESLKNSDPGQTPWREELDGKVQDLLDRQMAWEDHFTTLQNQQEELKSFFERAKERQQAAEARDMKKEAKKHNNLGVTSFHNGSYELAKEQFLKAVKLDDESAEAYNNLGLACTELGEEEEATEAFKKAIQRNPGLAAAYTNLGYVFYRQGSYEEAIEMYNEALGRNSNNSSAYTNLGNAYYKLGEMENAEQAWNKSIEIDPGNDRAKRYLDRLQTK